MARKTNKPADEQQKPFDPWTATPAEAWAEAERAIKEMDFNEICDNPRLDPLQKYRAAQNLLAAKEQRGGTGQCNRGVLLLSGIQNAISSGLELPPWVADEVGQILSEIESGRPSGSKGTNNTGWNNEKVLGWPYSKGQSPLIAEKNKRIAGYIWVLMRPKGELKEELAKVKARREKFEVIADFLKARGIVKKLSGSMAEKIYDEYAKQFDGFGKKNAEYWEKE